MVSILQVLSAVTNVWSCPEGTCIVLIICQQNFITNFYRGLLNAFGNSLITRCCIICVKKRIDILVDGGGGERHSKNSGRKSDHLLMRSLLLS